MILLGKIYNNSQMAETKNAKVADPCECTICGSNVAWIAAVDTFHTDEGCCGNTFHLRCIRKHIAATDYPFPCPSCNKSIARIETGTGIIKVADQADEDDAKAAEESYCDMLLEKENNAEEDENSY